MIAWVWASIAIAQPLPEDVEGAPEDPIVDDTGAADAEAEEAPPAPVVPPISNSRPTFLAGDNLSITGATGDVFATARLLKVASALPDNAFLVGQTVEIAEEVAGDTLLMGQTVYVNAPVRGDVYAVGEEVRIEAPVYGTVYTAGNRVRLASDVYGAVEASAREIELSGHLHNDTSLQFATVKISKEARVEGDLSYVAPRRRDGFEAVVDGAVRFKLGDFNVDVDPSNPMGLAQQFLWGIVGIIRAYIGLLAVGAVLLGFAGPFVRGPSKVASEQPVMAAALGFVATVVTPVAASIAILLFVTIPLGVIALALYGVGLYVVQLFTASAIGHLFNRRFLPAVGDSDIAALATGLVPLVVLSAIPQFVGTVVWLLATFVGFGALWLHQRDEARDRRIRKQRA